MSGITPYSPAAGNVADRCLDVAADVGSRLGQLRRHLASLDRVGVPDLPAGRLQDLLAGYDVYVRMLHDALHDIARDLQATHRSDVELVGGDLR
ncbi:hypothetical protein O7623_19040 [Solwaraspora sp. WMMD791]|uniref:hypothetical protein n=1 Tax=Solwaraspora sp. WMMD791 TaxID=3016086 RepID=UPI00249B31E7|nr:hypothetical protein [Solwaraspora sp. WMMD791]WFE25481.1 hypothetical protein O7623_19040 [Solwaraspora sp. WMMD791]